MTNSADPDQNGFFRKLYCSSQFSFIPGPQAPLFPERRHIPESHLRGGPNSHLRPVLQTRNCNSSAYPHSFYTKWGLHGSSLHMAQAIPPQKIVFTRTSFYFASKRAHNACPTSHPCSVKTLHRRQRDAVQTPCARLVKHSGIYALVITLKHI